MIHFGVSLEHLDLRLLEINPQIWLCMFMFFKGVAFGELKIPVSAQLGNFLNALKLICTSLLWFGVQEGRIAILND